MALQATTNLHGTVGSDSTAATLLTIAAGDVVSVSITGSGAARLQYNSSVPSLLTANSIAAGVGIVPFKAPLGTPGITTLLMFANGSETTLTYDVVINKPSAITTS